MLIFIPPSARRTRKIEFIFRLYVEEMYYTYKIWVNQFCIKPHEISYPGKSFCIRFRFKIIYTNVSCSVEYCYQSKIYLFNMYGE